MLRRYDSTLIAVLLATSALAVACAPPGGPAASGQASLVHLTEKIEAASVVSAASPAKGRERMEWLFPASEGDWTTLSSPAIPHLGSVDTQSLEDGLRLSLGQPTARQTLLIMGGLMTELSGQRLGDWETVLVRARSSDRLAGLKITHNVADGSSLRNEMSFFFTTGDVPPIFADGSEQIYALPLEPRDGETADTPLDNIGIVFGGPSPASVDVLSIALVPRGAAYAEDHGVRYVTRDGFTSPAVFAHAPGSLSYELDIQPDARLDMALTTESDEAVTYRVSVDTGSGDPRQLFEQAVSSSKEWVDVSVDLSRVAGSGRKLILEASSPADGAVAIWGTPMVSSPGPSEMPNIIFYVIDGAGADLMSVYGYNRRTTPYMEELAKEGALFENAYSNSTWTQPSTASFMTSLHHSVLGGLRRGIHSTPIPNGATTMAERMRDAGYLTMSFTANPNAGRLIGTGRGVDIHWDTGTEHHSTSSVDLHDEFWYHREHFPGEPYWVHFQTTDVHEPNQPKPPYAGLYVRPEERDQLAQWDQQFFMQAGGSFGQTSVSGFYDIALERTGIDRQAYFGVRRGLYDETMTHQDAQLRRLVDRLKARGEWDNTLLVIGSDHGHPAGTFARFGRGLFDPQPEPWQGALFDAYATRVPMIVIWPDGIEAGQRYSQPVSMIDVLPTVLELAGLEAPEVLQGQSLAPLLRGENQEIRPVIFDEFRVHEETGEMLGNLEIIDGRWGASLEIGPNPNGPDSLLGRHAVPVGGRWGAVHPFYDEAPRLLLYDLWNDPFALNAVNEEHPELVDSYTRLLLTQWKAHQALAQRFLEAEETPLSPDQLEQLRALGYIQ